MPASGREGTAARGITPRQLWGSLAAYVALISVLAIRHEMWRDEVRAFSVATRTASWGQLVAELHHEGHPILWYAILRIGYAATHSHLVLPVAALVIATVTAYLILRFAPFPVWLRMLAVFGAFLGYELSVVARNYGIGVLLMIVACIVFPLRRQRPLMLGMVLALMANTSVHAAFGALVFVFIWLSDLLDREQGRLEWRGVMAIALSLSGAGLALWSARPTPDMAWAFWPGQLSAGGIVRTILTDPGWALSGVTGANVAAAGELPWRLLHIDRDLASRVIVDICLLSVAWSLRRNRACLAAMIVTILGFEVLFRHVYSGGLRHEGMIAFLLFSICWIAVAGNPGRSTAGDSRRMAFGLLPLFVVQSAALPVMAHRYFTKPVSGSKAYGEFIEANPRFRDAILASEPDYLMESMPYYVPNRVYMPRQGEFHYRVYFDRGQRRQQDLTLGRLIDVADSVACANGQPVLLALGNTEMPWKPQGEAHPAYPGTVFRWTAAERERLRQRGVRVASFPRATSDEFYDIVEIAPTVLAGSRCRGK